MLKENCDLYRAWIVAEVSKSPKTSLVYKCSVELCMRMVEDREYIPPAGDFFYRLCFLLNTGFLNISTDSTNQTYPNIIKTTHLHAKAEAERIQDVHPSAPVNRHCVETTQL